MLQAISGWILIVRGWWVTVQHCARRKRASIFCASNHPTLPWNITSKVRKIRATLKRRSNLLACIGKPLPAQSGKIPASSKAAVAAAATTAAILHRLHPRKKSIWIKREIHREDRIWTTISGWQTCRRHSVDTLIFKYVWFDTTENPRERCTHTLLTRRFLGDVTRIGRRVILPVLRRRLGKNSCVRINCNDSTAEGSKQDLKSVKMQTKNWVIFMRSEDIQRR